MSQTHIYEVRHPEYDINIHYRVLTPSEAESIIENRGTITKDHFSRLVIESVIVNINEVMLKIKELPRDKAVEAARGLYNGSVMLNPTFDIDSWLQLSFQQNEMQNNKTSAKRKTKSSPQSQQKRALTKSKFLNLSNYLKSKIIGQDHAIDEVVNSLKRAFVGLSDQERPKGVFLFAGASGIGKSLIAKELHKYLYGDQYSLVRIDCGEYQQKHEGMKIGGAPPSFVGYEDGGQLTSAVSKHPHTVILLDEVEKAHPDLWHTFLKVFDEGSMRDGSGQEVSFKDTIIIMTTNLGNKEVVREVTSNQVGFGSKEKTLGKARSDRYALEAINKYFSVELLNRLDNIVVFNTLTNIDFQKITDLELRKVDEKLIRKGFSLEFDDDVLNYFSLKCLYSVENARKIIKMRRDEIENKLADIILNTKIPKGTIFSLTITQQGDINIEKRQDRMSI